MQLLLLACEAETWESQLLCRTVSLKSGMSPRLTHIRCCAQDIFDLANYEYADMIDLTDCAPGAILFSDLRTIAWTYSLSSRLIRTPKCTMTL